MIQFLVRSGYNTIRRFCAHVGEEARRHVRVINYRNLRVRGYLPRGCTLFSSLDVISPEHRAQLAALAVRIRDDDPTARILNHPARAMARYELLRTLHEKGLNDFNVYRLDEMRRPERYPVFLRGEFDHDGNITPLLETEEEYVAAVARHGAYRSDILTVEFVDTRSPDGVFRKYSTYVVAGRVFPAHIFSSRQWMVKLAHYDIPEYEAEMEFAETNPHREKLEEITRIAGIDYGRIDYGLHDGRVQVFEINTNPTIVNPVVLSNEARRPVVDKTLAPVWATMVELARASPSGGRIPIADLPGYRPPGWRRTWNRLFTR